MGRRVFEREDLRRRRGRNLCAAEGEARLQKVQTRQVEDQKSRESAGLKDFLTPLMPRNRASHAESVFRYFDSSFPGLTCLNLLYPSLNQLHS